MKGITKGFILLLSGMVFISTSLQTERLPHQSLIDSSPILITSDNEFDQAAIDNEWPGLGTIIYPYIIQNIHITAAETMAIDIEHTTRYFIIEDCWLDTAIQNGIYLSNVSHGIILGNLFTACDWGIFCDANCQIIDVDNNTINDCISGGIYADQMNDSIISNNFISAIDESAYGIAIDNSQLITIQNNIAAGVLDNDFMMGSSMNCTMDGNIVINTFGYGFLIQSSDTINILNNYVYSTSIPNEGTTAFALYTLSDCYLNNNSADGIDSIGFDLNQVQVSTFINCIANNSDCGFNIGGSGRNTFRNCSSINQNTGFQLCDILVFVFPHGHHIVSSNNNHLFDCQAINCAVNTFIVIGNGYNNIFQNSSLPISLSGFLNDTTYSLSWNDGGAGYNQDITYTLQDYTTVLLTDPTGLIFTYDVANISYGMHKFQITASNLAGTVYSNLLSYFIPWNHVSQINITSDDDWYFYADGIGNGTINNPWIVQNFSIPGDGNHTCIDVQNTRQYAIIREGRTWNTTISCIRLLNATNLIMRNCRFETTLSTFHQKEIQNCSSMLFENTTTVSSIQLSGTNFYNNSNSLNFTNCDFGNNSLDFLSCSDLRLVNCHFARFTNLTNYKFLSAIYFNASNNILVDYCQFDDVLTPISFVGHTNHITFSNSIIHASGRKADIVVDESNAITMLNITTNSIVGYNITNCNDFILSDLDINDASESCLLIANASDALITNCLLTTTICSSYPMIVYNSSRTIFTNCTITGTSPAAFNIQMRNNTDTRFIDCHFKYNSIVFTNVTNATVNHCTFQYLDLNNDIVLSIVNGTANFTGNAYWNYFIETLVVNQGYHEGDILPNIYLPTDDSKSFYSEYLFGVSPAIPPSHTLPPTVIYPPGYWNTTTTPLTYMQFSGVINLYTSIAFGIIVAGCLIIYLSFFSKHRRRLFK
jgi:parallel beta-helix repeat protein